MYVRNRRTEHNAFGLLDELYKIDKEKSHKLLTRELKTWRNTSVFQVADKANLMDFMQHDCCQTKLDKIWHGKLSTRTAMWQVGPQNSASRISLLAWFHFSILAF